MNIATTSLEWVHRSIDQPIYQLRGFAFALILASVFSLAASGETIEVDVVNVAAATVSDSVANVPVRLSVVPSGDRSTRIERMIVRVRPRQVNQVFSDKHSGDDRGEWDSSLDAGFGHVLDYSPRTQTAAIDDQPVIVRTTDERNEAAGLSVDGVYGSIGTVHGGLDKAEKTSRTVESKRLPALVASISSGTFDRGAGVLFKLDATPHLVIEGERRFELHTSVGPNWRGGLVDVEVDLHVRSRQNEPSFWEMSFDPDRDQHAAAMTIKHHHFVVAIYRGGDASAASDAYRLAESESNLRSVARRVLKSPKRGWRERIINPLDLGKDHQDIARSIHWVGDVIAGKADPYRDRRISGLPMVCRTAAIDYVDSRDRLVFGNTDTNATALASWVEQRGNLSPH